MKVNESPEPFPSELDRPWCPACKGTDRVRLAIGLNGEACRTDECGLCSGSGERGMALGRRLIEVAGRAKP